MLGRVGFLVAASIAAYAVKRPRTPRVKPSGNGDTSAGAEIEADQREQNQDSSTSDRKEYAEEEKEEKEEEEEEEEEEKVKTISSFIGTTLPSNAALDQRHDDDDDELLPEFESLLSGEIDFPMPDNKYDTEMANNALELERLRSLVKDFEEREVKLEGELLEYYGLKEQETEFTDLQKQLKIKAVEVDMLNITISSLQAERKKLQGEVAVGVAARKELEAARNKIKELQRQIQLDAGQTKGQLLLLKQQVTGLKEKEEEAARKDAELERKLKAVRDLEVEVVELRRKSKELQHEKRDLSVKLASAEARANELSNMNETEMVARAREEISKLRHANEDLTKQVEGLQINRFSEVEELVYLRWVNACLRFELRNYQTPSGKVSARDLSKSLSPRSQERAKLLMTEYAGSERGQGDTDLESISSMPSSPGSEDFDNASIDSSTSRFSFMSKSKPNLIQKLKRWGKSKDDSSVLASPTRSIGSSSPMRSSKSLQRPARGPLEALMLRNAGDYNAITTFGNNDLADDTNLPRIRTRVASNDSLNNVAASFQLMSKSVEGVADDKYPAFKDRHKLAMEREKEIKEKAEQARVVRFTERDRAALPPKLMQIKEKPIIVVNTGAGAGAGAEAGAENGSPSGNGGDSKAATMQVASKMRLTEIEKRAPRVPKPPPQRLNGTNSTKSGANISTGPGGLPPPPPPPPPPGAPPPPPPPGGPPRPPPPPGSLLKGSGGGAGVHRAPELVELYQSLMKRESKKDPASLASSGASAAVADARNNMIGEIANKSTFMLAVKADVETQGDFVQSLASEVRSASFTDIEDLVSFVNWLDEELSFLVDERAVLKHFDWPEGKADALREAAFEYQDLMKLEKQVTNFVDDPKVPCEAALKKMYSLLEKVEQSVYALLRTRDMAMSRYRDFGIPVDWLSDSGVVGKIKLSCVQLARKYMKRVSTELDALSGTDKEPNREFLLLQGVRFAFRVHQFSGGFDAESMRAFEELRSRVNSQGQPTTTG